MGQNILEINGKRYDVLSGKLIGNEQSASTPAKASSPKAHSGQVLDGFVKYPQKSPHHPAAPSHAVHAKNSRSKTLMRRAVKKPLPSGPTHTRKNYTVYQPSAKVDLKQNRGAQIDSIRAGRAADVPKSNLVSKFGDVRGHIIKRVAPLPVKPAPAHPQAALHTVSVPIDRPRPQAVVPESANPFDLALQNADSHTLQRSKKPSLRQRAARKLRISPRSLTIATGVFITLFLGGLVAYQNIPQLAIRMASTRAGVRANLPSYQPSGFSLSGPVQYGGGVVTLNYESNSDDRNFRVVQKNSDWNSRSLLENFVAAKDSYQTFQDKGRTVFVYDGSNATWVNGGVLYQIEGESELSSDQLRRIVSSL